MKMGGGVLLKSLAFAATALLMSCKAQLTSQMKDLASMNSSLSSKYNSAGFMAFQSGLYQKAQEKNCTKCHGSFQSPAFADMNIDHAYEEALTRLDLQDPASSKFADYASNGHCGDTPCQNAGNKAELEPLIQAWADAENADRCGTSCPPPVAAILFKTASLQVPATIPTISATTPGVLRFPLGSLSPAVSGLENAILEIEITAMNSQIYKLNKPRIIGATRAVSFKGLHVYIKTDPSAAVLGKEDTTYSPKWYDVNSTAAVVAKPNPLPARPITAATPLVTPMGAIYYKKISAATPSADLFTVGFEDIN